MTSLIVRHDWPRIVAPSILPPLLAVLLTLSSGCSGDEASPTQPSGGAPPPARVLVVTVTAGFRHSSIPLAETTIADLGRQAGLFETDFCRDGDSIQRLFTPAGLQPYAAVVFANTTGNLGIPDLGAFMDWISSGRAFVGTHSAADTYRDDPRYLVMLGNEFDTHGDQTEVDVRVDDPSHPAAAGLAPGFRILDEIYRFRANNRGRVTMVLSLDRFPNDGLAQAGQPGDLPLAWAKPFGFGRVFYTALGHREEVWQDPRFRQHLAGALRWALGR
jgi:uncharacterized protein